MSKGRLRNLEMCFFWRRNGEVKKKKERHAKVGGKNSAPTLKTQQVAE